MPVALVHLDLAIDLDADRMASSVLGDITARCRSHLGSVEIVAPPTWCVSPPTAKLSSKDTRPRPRRDWPVRSARVAGHPRRSLAGGPALQDPSQSPPTCPTRQRGAAPYLLADLAFEPTRSPALESFAVTLLGRRLRLSECASRGRRRAADGRRGDAAVRRSVRARAVSGACAVSWRG